MTAFDFETAGRIRFGDGVSREAGFAAATWGRRALVVTGSDPGRSAPIFASLAAAGVSVSSFSVIQEPTVEMAEACGRLGRAKGCQLVVGVGGGSVIDTAKAAAALLTNDGGLVDYLEVVGRGLPLPRPAAPVIAIPTTAGTGSEVARNAVLAVPDRQVKVSLRHPSLLPRLALVDPELTAGMSPGSTAGSGLDALCQLIEPYTSSRANALTDALCRQAIPMAAAALPRAFHDGADHSARRDMSFASLCGGMALTNAGLGVVHAFAGAIGGRYAAPHGAVCGRLLPPAVSVNLQALRRRDPDGPALGRYAQVAAMVTGDVNAESDDLARWLAELVDSLGVPRLASYGMTAAAVPSIVAQAAAASSMRANPTSLSVEELGEILARAL